MKWLTEADKANMTTLDILKHETIEYLTNEHNNQIHGFYEFSGYWSRKDEAMRQLSAERKQYLAELFDYMTSITIENIVAWTREDGKGYQSLYAGTGRYSESYKYQKRQAQATKHTDFIKSNYGILRRVRWHVGAVLNRLTLNEVKSHVDEVAKSEIENKFWNDKGSRFSNAIFRLEICKTWLAGTNHEAIIDNKLAEVSQQYLAFKEIDITSISALPYVKTMEELRQVATDLTAEQAEHKRVICEADKVKNELHKQMDEANVDVGGMRLTEALKLKEYITK